MFSAETSYDEQPQKCFFGISLDTDLYLGYVYYS